MASCMAFREAESVDDCAWVPWGSKSFSPRRGREGAFKGLREMEREERKRKSWVSSSRSGGWFSVGEAIVVGWDEVGRLKWFFGRGMSNGGTLS